MGKCKFNVKWLERDDGTGRKVSDWAKKQNDHEVFCTVCARSISVESKGFQAILQHASSEKHKTESRTKLQPKQLRLESIRTNSGSDSEISASTSTSVGTLKVYSLRDETTTAELIWCLKCISSDFSAASCRGIGDTFKAMFHSPITDNFTLGSTKASYLITEALAPFFKSQLYKDLDGVFYSMSFDETTNNGGKKELQICVRYWSAQESKIVTKHLQTFFIGRATAIDLKEKLCEAVNNSPLLMKNIIMIGSDGPNVNKAVFRLMNDVVKSVRTKPLIDVGFCNIHTGHNAFLKGLEELGEEASELVFAVHHFFDGWPSRWEEFERVQDKLKLKNHHFIKHVPSRWLTLEVAAERLLEQWDALEEYFLVIGPKNRTLADKPLYKKIVRLLRKSTMKAEVTFVISSARLFTQFTGFFQREEPLIHRLYSELKSLAQKLMRRVCKRVDENDMNDSVFRKENLVAAESVVISSEVSELLKSKKINEKERLFFFTGVQNHYIVSCKYILRKSSLTKGSFLESCRFLSPAERTKERSLADVIHVAKSLPLDIPTDVLSDEWRLLQCEKEDDSLHQARIDLYWNQFLSSRNESGDFKYPVLSKVVKAVLCISHGSADLERGFSATCRILTADKASMSERTLNAFLAVKGALRTYNNMPHFVPITPELLALARSAWQRYESYLEEERSKKEDEKKRRNEEEESRIAEKERMKKLEVAKRKLDDDQEMLKKIRLEEDEKASAADKLLLEANRRLKSALEKKDFAGVALAQAMLEGVTNVRNEVTERKRDAAVLQESVQKRQSGMISSLFQAGPSRTK